MCWDSKQYFLPNIKPALIFVVHLDDHCQVQELTDGSSSDSFIYGKKRESNDKNFGDCILQQDFLLP
jgi:hypothetical protein